MSLQDLINGVKKIKADAEVLVNDVEKTSESDWAAIFHQALEDVLQLCMNHLDSQNETEAQINRQNPKG